MPPNYPTSRQQLLRVLFLLTTLVVLFLGGRLVVHFLATATLTVTTGSPAAQITVSSAPSPTGETKVTRQGKGSLTTHVPSGAYVVSVQSATSATNQIVHLGWRSSKTISVNPAGRPAATEPVLYEGVVDLVADNNRLMYLTTAEEFNGVEYIDTNNQATTIADNLRLVSVAWASTQYGVAQDSDGKLYVVHGGAIHPLQPSILKGKTDAGTMYAVAPDRTIYVGIDSALYRGTEQSGFQQIYDKLTVNDRLVAANGQVLVLDPGQTSSQRSGSATIVTTEGKVISKSLGAGVGGWTPWSQNGKYIVISVGQQPQLFDATLKRLGSIPQPALSGGGSSTHTSVINDGAWLGDTLFYYYGTQLWSYSVSGQTTRIIATVSDSQLIQSVAVNADGSYVYLTTANVSSSDPSAVLRVGLHGQPVADKLLRLQNVLPITLPGYTIGLRNFAGSPTIMITAFPGTDPNSTIPAAEAIIQGVIDPTGFNFDAEQGD
jgi:hypothetical protein